MNPPSRLQQFRQAIYALFPKRADTLLDLIDALTVAGHVASPVALSEEAPFRRTFSALYDALAHGEIDVSGLHSVLATQQPAECEQIAGYDLYAVDTTPDVRPEADTLAERGCLKAQKKAPVQFGQKYSWLVRLVASGTSWVAPWDVRRVAPTSTDNQTAVEQLQALERQNTRPKVVVGDSLYANRVFLAVFLVARSLWGLVRLRGNMTLYEHPPVPAPGQRGAPRKHGAKFRLKTPPRAPDRTETFCWGLQQVRLRAWHQLHFRWLPTLLGVVMQVEFLKADGTARYARPLWLFWTGPDTVALQALCRMYLWRFAIEHAFRFLKQHLGLTAHCLTDNAAIQRWMWVCALAYWQLLLMRHEVDHQCPAWYPRSTTAGSARLSPGQVQRDAARFLAKLGTPAASPRRAGKGRGRAKGYQPAPRPRYPVVRKGKQAPKPATPTANAPA